MSHTLLHSIRCVVLALLFAFAIVPNLVAQTTDEWTTTWMSPDNNVANFSRVVSSAGKGDYIMASEVAVYRTSDGGVTWTSIMQKPGRFQHTFTGVAYPNRNRLLVVTDSVSYNAGGEGYFAGVVVSADAGSTWTGADRIWTGRISSISMFDNLDGLVALAAATPTTDSLLRTTDGGVTWIGHSMPPGARYPDYVFAAGRSTWFARAYDTATSSTRLYRTTDAGVTWSVSILPAGVYTLAIVDALNIWVAGGIRPQQGSSDTARDIIMHSTDGGASWTVALDAVLQYTYGIRAMAFADASNGIAGGASGQLYRTTDGGLSWERQWMPSGIVANYAGARNIAYPVADEAIAVTGNFGVAAYHGKRTLIAPRIVSPKPSNSLHPLEATITWTSVAGATGYDVQIGDTVFEYNVVDPRYFDEPYLERTALTDTILATTFQPHKRYITRVRARNDSMIGDWSPQVHVITVGEGKTLARPIILTPRNGSTNQPLELDLTWTEVPTAIGYDYRVALEPTLILTHVDEENYQGTSARVTGLRRDTDYWARVRARDADGVMSDYYVIAFRTGSISSAHGEVATEFSASLQPNISNDVARLHLSIARSGGVRIDVVNVAGATVHSAQYDRLESGIHDLPIDVSSLPSGQYFVRIDIGGRVVSLRLIIAK